MFLSGVIEGFYGRAWRDDQRVEMLDWIRDAAMNVFVYAPKDDLHVRARWRQCYKPADLDALHGLVRAAQERGVQFMVAIAPCLDITYSDPAELDALCRRLDQLTAIGVDGFALLFDDIPNRLPERDGAAFASFAAAQSHIANAALAHLQRNGPPRRLLFCPTEYCARFAGGAVRQSPYLRELGTALDPAIGVFWTGPEIVSAEISAASLAEVGAVLKRKPVIWENFHANDYDIRRVYAGPLGGRAPDILPLISGLITNPNNEFEANFVPVRTTGRFAAGAGCVPGQALAQAIAAWQPRFRLAQRDPPQTLTVEEIRLLAELFYQPFACGPEITALLETARALLTQHRPDVDSSAWRAGLQALRGLRDRVRDLFDRMTELDNRDLFYAFHPYLWEARAETTHLVTYLDWLAERPAPDAVFPGEERIYNFYRRGFTVAVQELLKRDAGGRYHHGA